jgi:hypothetical protein
MELPLAILFLVASIGLPVTWALVLITDSEER